MYEPDVTVVIVCMKPLSEKSYVDQALANGKGVTWLDDCRIPHDLSKEPDTGDMYYLKRNKEYPNQDKSASKIMGQESKRVDITMKQGRFPANLLVSNDVLGVYSRGQIAATTGEEPSNHKLHNTYGDYRGYGKAMEPRNDAGSFSRYFDLDTWTNKQENKNMNSDATILQGDALDKLKEVDENSIDLILTDPPYGYSFMGKDWDKAVPKVEIWQECLRVLKPGGWCFVMSAPRQDVLSRMIVNLEDAGFDTSFTSIYWAYASGFPKASNISKQIDKRLGANRKTESTTEQAKNFDGAYSGFQPKPAVEVILCSMKPLSEKSYVDQALANGKGITWLDDCRVPYKDQNEHVLKYKGYVSGEYKSNPENATFYGDQVNINPAGRFPANLLASDDVLDDGKERTAGKYNGEGSKSGGIWQESTGEPAGREYGDSGAFSRYFDLDAWATENKFPKEGRGPQHTFPFMIVPKASKSEKNKGLDNFETKKMGMSGGAQNKGEGYDKGQGIGLNRVIERRNIHPTVKPLKLMRYLITLATREGDTVLDPFVGSGTTCIAAKELGRKSIGIELEEEYVKIAEARLKGVPETLDKFFQE